MSFLSFMRRAKSILTNCGGRNARTNRYAGRLVASLPDEEFVAICHCLIFENGTRKTTERCRNLGILQDKLNGRLNESKSRLSVLDAGASIGLDSLATIDWLQSRHSLQSYVLGDLYTHILIDENGGFVFDQDGGLLQVKGRSFFTAMNFSFQYGFQKYINLWNFVRTSRLKRTLAGRSAPDSSVLVPLIHPSLKAAPFSGVVSSQRVDVFGKISGQYDLIVCMNLLVRRYFDTNEIAKGISNLADALAPGGVLVAGANDGGVVFARSSDGNTLSMLEKW